MKNIAFKADVEVRKLSNHLVRKTLVTKLKDSNQRRSANKVKQATQAIVHWQTTWKLTKQNGDRSHPSSALDLCPRWRVASKFPSSSFQFSHTAQPYTDSSLPKCSPPLPWLSGDEKLLSWR